jgi:1-deoxyxylulose-5-phosphate synthase
MAPPFAPRRLLGRTGFIATALGQGDLADRAAGEERCAATLRRALDAGLNVVDTAPAYEDGFSEQVVAAALRGRREGIFVVDKVDHLDRPVGPQVEESLRRLELATVDLFALHAVSREAWAAAAAPGGALDALEEEVRRGRARFRGLSSHDPEVLAAALDDGRCDVLMFPVGAHAHPRYTREILPRARALGIGAIGFKVFGAGKLVGDSEGYGRPTEVSGLQRLEVEACLRYTLTRDPDVALLGLSTPAEQDEAFAAAARFVPMSETELLETERRAAAAVQGKGRVWWDPPGAR